MSPDDRLTLTVPPNALTETVPFSIQPITNKVDGGIGLAYRLEPDGTTFPNPLEISIRYNENDLEGTIPEVLALAYQDKQGAWHEVKAMSQTEDTLTVATTHFTDWSVLAKMRLEPAKATLGVRKTLYVVLIGCKQDEPTIHDRIRKFFWGGTDRDGRPLDPDICRFGPLNWIPFKWYVDIGTIGDGENPVLYTAPPKKPTPNIATISFPYSVREPINWRGGKDKYKEGIFTSKITIVDRGYRATGQDGPTSYSGVICSLDKQFTVIGHNGPLTYTDVFTPSSGLKGTATLSGQLSGVIWAGNGPYTVEGIDTENPRIVWQVTTAVRGAGGGSSGSGTATINLVPLETDECK